MIQVDNLGLIKEGDVILRDVSFSIGAGEYVGLIGPNGAGKTSLIKTILGLNTATSGSLQLSDGTVTGYVPQSYLVSDVVPISVQEIIKMSGVKNVEVIIQSLEKVGLKPDFMNRCFHDLSGGQKQRVIIARALCKRPNLLLFDEPLNGVDITTKRCIYRLLSDLNKTEKLTILFVSHEVDHLISQCDRVLCLNQTLHEGCSALDFSKGNIVPECGPKKNCELDGCAKACNSCEGCF